jgi:hypothetical protein
VPNLPLPFYLILAAGAVLALGAALLTNRGGGSGQRVALLALAIALVVLPALVFGAALFPELFDARIRTYKRFYRNVEVGMTRDELLAVMRTTYEAAPQFAPPRLMTDTPERIFFLMDPQDSGGPNAEGIGFTLTSGKVSHKSYARD